MTFRHFSMTNRKEFLYRSEKPHGKAPQWRRKSDIQLLVGTSSPTLWTTWAEKQAKTLDTGQKNGVSHRMQLLLDIQKWRS